MQTMTGMIRKYEKGEVDYFAIYCPPLNEIYGMSFEATKLSAWLRIEPTINKQKKLIRWAKDYSWKKHIAELKGIAGGGIEPPTCRL
jgi:PD-(D/E)XK endonuclease